ncbi:MAG: ATP-binding protein [Nocardioidaceae bacterium]|nr:ATP-binding protein [Nocardioidaceae bacterium]
MLDESWVGDQAVQDFHRADQLDISADLALLGEVRAWVRQRAEPGEFIARDLDDIELAVTEAVSNVIRHAYGGVAEHQVSIRADLHRSHFVVTIFDEGPPFRGTASSPVLDSHEGGRGLEIISAVMDEASWTRLADGRNELRLVRKRPEVQT